MNSDFLAIKETRVLERDLPVEQTKSYPIQFNFNKKYKHKSNTANNITNTIFGIDVLIPANDYSPSSLDITSTVSNSGNYGLTLRSRLDAAKIKANSFLNSKTVTLTKHLDAYGVIDIITEDKKNKNTKISARIYNITDHEFVDEIIFISKEFSESDQKKLVENAIFYWHVGVEKNIFGREKHVSEFRLRRVAKR